MLKNTYLGNFFARKSSMNGYPFFRIICGSRVVIYIISLLNVGEKKIETKRDEAGDRRDCLIITGI